MKYYNNNNFFRFELPSRTRGLCNLLPQSNVGLLGGPCLQWPRPRDRMDRASATHLWASIIVIVAYNGVSETAVHNMWVLIAQCIFCTVMMTITCPYRTILKKRSTKKTAKKL